MRYIVRKRYGKWQVARKGKFAGREHPPVMAGIDSREEALAWRDWYEENR